MKKNLSHHSSGRQHRFDRAIIERMAVEILSFLGEDEDRLGRFFDLTGLTLQTLREVAGTRAFEESLFDYLGSDEALLRAFADRMGYDPEMVDGARSSLDSTRSGALRSLFEVSVSMSAYFCRDCLVEAQGTKPRRCPNCGSPRLLAHPELDRLAIAHVDCDAFYATVEKRDHPELRDKPVIIGGGRRGVVLTACYIARTYGVRSAMPMFKALNACPEATIVKPDMAKYARVGRDVRVLMGELTPLVQPVSIDEAFLDLNGTAAVHGASPARTLARFARRLETEIGISVSVGLSDCKFLAKFASDLDKPRGFTVIGRAEAAAFLRPRPVGAIWGVGAVSRERLEALGFETIGDIQDCDEATFLKRAGSHGAGLWRLAHGIDARPVSPIREAKSISSETTFGEDLASADHLLPVLYRLCEKVALRLTHADLAAGGVVLKLKTTKFQIRTRSRAGLAPTQLATKLFKAGRSLLLPEIDGTRFRLLGLGATDLRPGRDADQGDLVDHDLPRQKAAARAIDSVRERFGGEALVRGITLTGRLRRP